MSNIVKIELSRGNIDVDLDRMFESDTEREAFATLFRTSSALRYFMHRGMIEGLTDAYATDTKKGGGTNETGMALVAKKLDAIMSGTLGERVGRGSAKTPVEREAMRIAWADWHAARKAETINRTTAIRDARVNMLAACDTDDDRKAINAMDDKAVVRAIVEMMALDPTRVATATANIAAASTTAKTIDVAALFRRPAPAESEPDSDESDDDDESDDE